MKKRYTRTTLKSFTKLGAACEMALSDSGAPSSEMIESCDPEEIDDLQLFSEAVVDVEPLAKNYCSMPLNKPVLRSVTPEVIDKSVPELKNLGKLLLDGIGSALSSPAPYFRNDLYLGYSRSTCNSLDLHGHTVAEAKVAFDNFLAESALLARSSVLIIHGRGLSSSGEPILKKKVKEWLGRGMRQNLLHSFSGASPEDGGEGATFVRLCSND